MNESDDVDIDLTVRERISTIARVARYNPLLTGTIVLFSLSTAALEGIGIGYLVPIIEQIQGSGGIQAGDTGAIGRVFADLYAKLGVPFTLVTIIGGLALVMTIRHVLSFLVRWLQAVLRTHYMRSLKTEAFQRALDARVSYFDRNGSDEILNAIVTQSKYASRVIRDLTGGFKQGVLVLTYIGIALYIAPFLTVFAVCLLGGLVWAVRWAFESALSIGSDVADANERLQSVIQTGTQGIRDIKLFGMGSEVFAEFDSVITDHTESKIALRRSRAGLSNSYALVSTLAVFFLLFLAVEYAALSIAELGMYLFAIYRLAPQVSSFNKTLYKIEENLPHLVRTHRFIDTLERYEEPDEGSIPVPDEITPIAFEDVRFSYDDPEPPIDGSLEPVRSDGSGRTRGIVGSEPTASAMESERTLDSVSFRIDRGEFVAFVGPSGAGKSTIASLAARLYRPDSGTITANGTPIDRFGLREWRSKIAVVRQHPFIFNETLAYNVTVGNRNASREEIERACELAAVTEFLDDLPNGYETQLGEDGVLLSGGQRQRIAIARAILKDADLLILDEATSDLDASLEQRVHDAIESMDDCALLVIAHNLSTVTDADRIHYLENGRILESGSFQELLDREGSFAELYERQ